VQFIRSLLIGLLPGISPLKFLAIAAFGLALPNLALPNIARAEAWLVVEADTGRVLQADNATMPWYPASVTKIMTAFV
jgi:D-alanyl-D-alanine carboxypeptidase